MIIAIPDTHGRWDLLDPLLERVFGEWGFELEGDNLLIFLADMVDRGRQSYEVVEYIKAMALLFPKNVIALKGNHERLCLNAYKSLVEKHGSISHPMVRYGSDGWICATPEVALWIRNGGYATAKSWAAGHVSQEVLDWMESLPLSFETEHFFFSHAPVPKDEWRQERLGYPYSEHELTWTYFDGYPEHTWCEKVRGKIGVCGHVHQLLLGIKKPRFYDHYYFLDAGAGCSNDAPLVAVNVETKETLYQWPK